MKAPWPGVCLIALAASLAPGQRRGDVPPELVWDSLKGNCPAHLDWVNLRGNAIVISFGADDVFPDEIAQRNEILQKFQDQAVLFVHIVDSSEFLLDQALKTTPYLGCLLDRHEVNRRNFKLPPLQRTVVVDQFGYIAGYDHTYPDEDAIQRLVTHQVATGLFEEPPPPHPYEGQGTDLVPSYEVLISPAQKDELRVLGLATEPDLYLTKNQPLRLIILDLWRTPMAKIQFPENLDQGYYDVTARMPLADNQPLLKLVREAVEMRFGLRIEREVRTVAAYVLTASRPSAHLQPATEQDGWMSGGSEKSIIGSSQTMGDIAAILEDLLRKPVIDETGVEGKYNYSASSSLSGTEAVFDFAHQLGLELTPAARPVEMLIVRSVVP